MQLKRRINSNKNLLRKKNNSQFNAGKIRARACAESGNSLRGDYGNEKDMGYYQKDAKMVSQVFFGLIFF